MTKCLLCQEINQERQFFSDILFLKKKLIEMKLYTKRKEIEILLLTYHNL